MDQTVAEAASAQASVFVERCRLLPNQAADLERYLARKRARVEGSTYMQCVNNLLTYLMPEVWQQPEAAAVAIRAKMAGLADTTRRVRIGEIRRFMQWLRDRGRFIDLEQAGAAIDILHFPRTDRPLPQTISFEEATYQIQRAMDRPLYSLPGPQTAALLLLHLHCGMRCSEALHLTWGEIDFDRRRAVLHWTPHRRLKTQRASRSIPLSGVLFDLLSHHRRTTGCNDPTARLFSVERHPFVQSRSRYSNPTSLRHTFASALAGHGLDPWRVARFMGHSSPETTARFYVGAFVRIPYFEPSLFVAG